MLILPEDSNSKAKQLSAASPETALSSPQTDAPELSNPAVAPRTIAKTRPAEKNLSRTVQVRSGDTLARIFARLDLNSDDLSSLLAVKKIEALAAQLQPGQSLEILTDGQQVLQEFIYDVYGADRLHFVRSGDTFKIRLDNRPLETRTAFRSGVIRRSFQQAALNADLSEPLIQKFVEIFQWHIDFALEIQPGDHFTVIYEEHYRGGEKAGTGDILAAEFNHGGETFRALRYTDPQGKANYYTPEGRIMRQTFLRSPLDYRRISSHFRKERWHPVLGVKRPHRGVDYAAPRGTPVWAAGDGVIESIGRKGGYGNCIVLRHGQRYTTLYGHLSRFRKGLRRGSSVESGEVIGYVGSTGLATGPHLHYEFRIAGQHVNPVTVDLPSPEPMSRFQMAHFRAQTTPLIAQLDVHQRVRVAFLVER